MLLRDKRLEVAFLEVARGGILRRGLPLRQSRAALVTNVAADHLGQYGVNAVEELAVAKFAVHRTRVFVDFAHNPHSISAVTNAMASIPAKRRFVMISHAGDRSNRDILDATKSALTLKPDVLMAAELPQYLRGREPGDTTQLTHQQAKQQSMLAHQLMLADGPAAGTQKILDQLQPGDLALLLVLSEREQVFDLITTAEND
jgi:hypothetical protein